MGWQPLLSEPDAPAPVGLKQLEHQVPWAKGVPEELGLGFGHDILQSEALSSPFRDSVGPEESSSTCLAPFCHHVVGPGSRGDPATDQFDHGHHLQVANRGHIISSRKAGESSFGEVHPNGLSARVHQPSSRSFWKMQRSWFQRV